ncbi:MAG TPA: peptidoglycan-binding domain-containing protein, partial [Xanthobacteraceae bacterium]
VQRGAGPIPPVTIEMTRELQQLLSRQGYDVGGVDGKLGIATRKAVKAAQLKLGLPADSYPTPELIERLRRR